MTRDKVEALIADKVREIQEIYKEYDDVEGAKVNIYFSDNCVSIRNNYWEHDKKVDYESLREV